MSPWDYLASLKHRAALIVVVTLLTLGAVGMWCWSSPRLYEGSASLLFGGFQPSTGADKTSSNDIASSLDTQANLIASGLVAQQVVTQLGLADRSSVVKRWRDATGGRGTVEAWMGRNLLGGLSVQPTKNASVLRIAYRSTDPDTAAVIANAFADTFVKTQLMLRVQPARVYSDWFSQRAGDVRGRLERAQARLTQYQREHQMVGGDRADVEMNRLAELSSQLAVAEAANVEAGARAGTSVASSPEVQSSAVVQGLKSNIATTSARLNQMASSLGPNHPDIIAIRAELNTLRAQLAQAIGSATHSVQVAGSAAQNRESGLRQRLAQQRAHVLGLTGNQDQLAVLQRDVDAAKAQYDGVTQRLNAMRLQSALPQADATVLDRAVPSYMPVSPNIPMRMVLGLFLGLALGTSLALFLEWRSPRFRTDGGLQLVTGLPVLTSLERGSSPPRLIYQR